MLRFVFECPNNSTRIERNTLKQRRKKEILTNAKEKLLNQKSKKKLNEGC